MTVYAKSFCCQRSADGDVWLAVGEDDSVELTAEELLDEFGPVTDDEEEVESCPICGVGGCAGHTRVAVSA